MRETMAFIYLLWEGTSPQSTPFGYTAATAINDNGNMLILECGFLLSYWGGGSSPDHLSGALATNALGINNTGNITGPYQTPRKFNMAFISPQ
jgi:hypothetical protein